MAILAHSISGRAITQADAPVRDPEGIGSILDREFSWLLPANTQTRDEEGLAA